MGKDNKKYIIISIILLLIVALTSLILFIYFKHTKSKAAELNSNIEIEKYGIEVLLDNNELIMYENKNNPTSKKRLLSEEVQFLDNISVKWLPSDITEHEGSHNGKNYIAYSFYIENTSDYINNYWYSASLNEPNNNANEAIRIMIYVNDEKTVYAKGNSIDGEPEPGTTKFRDDEDGTIIFEQRKDMKSGDLDKITVVVWVEGDDPDCVMATNGENIRISMSIFSK